MTETTSDPIYDITEGPWRVVAEDTETRGEARVRFWHEGELHREIQYPAYKVWNIAAHLADVIADFEHGMALASASGVPTGYASAGGMTRAEHLSWAKARALEYVAVGDVANAWNSIVSDLTKHPETADHSGIQLGSMLALNGNLSTVREVREFIEGLN